MRVCSYASRRFGTHWAEPSSKQQGRDSMSRPDCVRQRRDYGFFLPFLVVSIFLDVSIIFIAVSIFIPVSAGAAAGAGAGAIAGVAVSFAASSDFEQAVTVTASTAATKARRFMTFS